MFFEYALISSLLLTTLSIPIVLIIRNSIFKNAPAPDTAYRESQKKMHFQIKILYFFLISIFIVRFFFSISYPEQIVRLNTFRPPYGLDIGFVILQLTIAGAYLIWAYILSLTHHFKLLGKTEFIKTQLRNLSLFLLADALISGLFYLYISKLLLFTNVEFNNRDFIFAPVLLIWFLGVLFLVCLSLFFWIQRKRSRLLYVLFFWVIMISAFTALYVSFIQSNLYFDHNNLLIAFTYREFFYGWILVVFAFSAVASQFLSGKMIRLREQFLNRYFAVHYTLQLNRVSILAVAALIISALLPYLIVTLIAGGVWPG